MEEILCFIGAAIFSILGVVLGVRNRVGNRDNNRRVDRNDSANGRISDNWGGADNIIRDNRLLREEQERLGGLREQSDELVEKCRNIGERIRKRKQETKDE